MAPQSVSWRVHGRRVLACAILPVTLAIPVPPVQAQPVGLPRLGDTASMRLSPRTEEVLGAAIMADGRRDPDYIDDPAVSQYLTEMGRRLSMHVTGAPQVNVFAIRAPSINAFAMPGGHIGVHSGLVVAAGSEAELAGVLAHEIAHVAQRHVARGIMAQEQSSAMMLGVMLAAIAAAAAGASSLAQGAAMFGQAAAINSQLSFSRDAEREADRIGLQTMHAAGYDPDGMARMFSRLAQTARFNESTAASYASTHPLSIERLSDLQNRIRQVGRKASADSDTFWFVRARLRVAQGGYDRSSDPLAALRAEATESSGVRKAAALYGVAMALQRRGDLEGARRALQEAQRLGHEHPMLAHLAVELAMAEKQWQEAVKLSADAVRAWPRDRALALIHARALQRAGDDRGAAEFLAKAIEQWPEAEPELYRLAAESRARLGDGVASARLMADYFVLIGALPAAIGQLQQARVLSRDFYEQSVFDARIRELQRRQEDERAILAQFR